MREAVSAGEAIEYGFNLLLQVMLIGLIGGFIAIIGLLAVVNGNLLIGGIISLGGIIFVYSGFLGLLLKVIADGVKLGNKAADDGAPNSGNDDLGAHTSGGGTMDDRELLFSDEGSQVVQPDGIINYEFDISEYGYQKGEISLAVEAKSGTVDVFVTDRQDREDAQSVHDLSPVDELSRRDVNDEQIDGFIDPGEWAIIVWNGRVEPIDVKLAYEVEGIPHYNQ